MNQVEIAKKILEQGDCRGVGCTDCQFNGECLTWNKRDLTFKVKQWLKERESMIDLTKEQVFTEPVKAYVWNEDARLCNYRWLIGIRSFGDGLRYYCLNNINANKDLNKEDMAYTPRIAYSNCSITYPTIPIKKFKKWLTVEDVPVELWCNALFKADEEPTYCAEVMSPNKCTDCDGKLFTDLVYLPQGQPLTGEWLPFESEE